MVRAHAVEPDSGEEASMVMQWTVNPPPMARLVRSQYSPPKFWSRSLLVRISPCHGDGTSSILVETASITVKWPRGPRQVTANLYNRWFESNLHLQIILLISTIDKL